MVFLSSLGLITGLLWLGNIAVTIGLIATDMLTRDASSYIFSIVFSFAVGFGLLGGGALAITGARRFRQLEGGVVVWFTMLYVAVLPVCCLFGVPVVGWALYAWNQPEVKAIRAPQLPGA